MGNLPSCPNCGLIFGGVLSYGVSPPAPAEFSYLKAVGGATLIIMAVLTGLSGTFFALLAFVYSAFDESGFMILVRIALICYLLMAGCLVGFAALFRKRSRLKNRY